MLYYIAPYLSQTIWGPFRLLEYHTVLMGLGATLMACIVGFGLPRYWQRLPEDHGKILTPDGEKSRGKPTGAGFILVMALIPVLLLVLPWTAKLAGIVVCLFAAMLTGYLDDASDRPWGNYLKGGLDLAVAFFASLSFCWGKPVVFWLPLMKHDLTIPVWIFLIVSTLLLWMTINATNCSDGVDGLAGTLSLVSLFYLAGFLYLVIGHVDVSKYLLVPHNPDGARWTILLITTAGGLAGYLWHNAEPSKVLMGDAGSRFLGLLIGVAVLASGNPLLVLVMAPVVLVNGGTGIVKIATLRLLRVLGFDIRTPAAIAAEAEKNGAVDKKSAMDTALASQHLVVRALHSVRFPLHDHCRKNLKWSNPQVLVRFFIIQAFLTPLLLGLLVKIR